MTIKDRLINFLYNEDRAIASIGGAPAQETISSEAGRLQHHALWAYLLHDILDDIQADHCEKAITHATALDKVDDGHEQ